ncbi:MAG TPA: MBL fold metallo-hydrolase [Dehalococcoidia bacterium]|jgi:hydroxyacylglutathione hydrolase|nr:MBL fold metallo-hydrolase [Dehalococcoidia bacterium]
MADTDPSVNEIIVRGIVVGAFQENCWIIGNRRTGEAVCVDPGDQPDEILALAKDMGVRIKYVANSHAHIDHVLGVARVREATGARFLLHPADLELLRGTAASASRWLGAEIAQPPDPDAPLADGDEIDIDGLKLRVIHTPGHTQGSVCFYANGVVFAGDTLFQGSIGRTDLPGGDYDQEMGSIVERLLALPDDTIVLPGHMDQTTIGQERLRNPYVRMELAKRAGA